MSTLRFTLMGAFWEHFTESEQEVQALSDLLNVRYTRIREMFVLGFPLYEEARRDFFGTLNTAGYVVELDA